MNDGMIVDESFLLHDLEHYIRTNGIENENNRPTVEHVLSAERVREATKYQNEIHHAIFGEEKVDETKRAFLDRCKDVKISLRTAGGGVINAIPLAPLAEACDFVYTFASSEHWFSKDGTGMEICLEEFGSDVVSLFLKIIGGDDGGGGGGGGSATAVTDIPADSIVECCKLAHFLQCPTVLDEIVSVIEGAIDAKNCTCICALADELQLHSLFEKAVSFAIKSLDDMENDAVWDDVPLTLKNKVLSMRNVVLSSVLARGKKGNVFFSSSSEFLAIFADHVRYQEERLREAKLRNKEILEERSVGGRRLQSSSRGSVEDAAVKIAKQERRLCTLKVFYREQKAIFGRKDSSLGSGKGSFVL
mmetsp:Transcript_48516/g.58743  ORF Transcript_48516/g.58743 Transcript_48516/m.58743 type:complete len:361 (-) Transcript_48516:335-1417(-)|eukprot:CAMPEP_0172491670 /NCGR_PEP_ID=MMETSP1066-20121228/22538_1 /TAXON_ID=671091 /ORGANISM="Coscinodiscus wailesii, Strain CCMP2513" /LENGTH=360 /DNA_ID=CAMNT_0013260831 /DNA_START=203 /DNA_END=1285 /DNA_ORIENTATION=-